MFEISDADAERRNVMVSLAEDVLSPAALATRIVLFDVARVLVEQGRWPGARMLST